MKNIANMRFHSFGTMKIFERRRRVYLGLSNLITYLGFLVPLFVGSFVLAFDAESDNFSNYIIPIASGILIFQMSISLWASIEGWNSKLEYSAAAIRTNNQLYLTLDSIATNQKKLTDLELQKLESDYNKQDADDSSHGLSKNEHAFGYRSALIKFSQSCPTCGQKPQQMKPSNCDICGNFPRRYNW